MRRIIPVVMLLAVLGTGCDDKRVFDDSASLAGAVWSSDKPVGFEFDVADTVTLHNLYINLRNGEEYPYSNLFLFVELEFPNGKRSVDTIDCPLADAYGKWYGTGLGSIYDQRVLYRSRVRFPLSGHYRVEIRQAMRVRELEGIHDVGFRVSRAY
jgi:gliding motility-associated lipoprotein GldH